MIHDSESFTAHFPDVTLQQVGAASGVETTVGEQVIGFDDIYDGEALAIIRTPAAAVYASVADEFLLLRPTVFTAGCFEELGIELETERTDLLLIHNSLEGHIVEPIKRGATLVVGRAACFMSELGTYTSREHFQIHHDPSGAARLTDLHSTFGTLLITGSGLPIAEQNTAPMQLDASR